VRASKLVFWSWLPLEFYLTTRAQSSATSRKAVEFACYFRLRHAIPRVGQNYKFFELDRSIIGVLLLFRRKSDRALASAWCGLILSLVRRSIITAGPDEPAANQNRRVITSSRLQTIKRIFKSGGDCGAQKLRRSGIHPCNNVTQPHRILLIFKSAGVFRNHK